MEQVSLNNNFTLFTDISILLDWMIHKEIGFISLKIRATAYWTLYNNTHNYCHRVNMGRFNDQ